ncbi:selenide, water dikinase SelD [Microbulbifer sp. CAU 1566]|uniref:selenide, water dikinase SelD n=1 Tax=Microbulbifer sp. CAU 1566 TaxID=2933269 RepID=UPI002005686F|nr:selenide, water dikinase SelD [Microbulbifer sp. CAU 1566]MCK7598658.1 selenide, water dikinase SelD [Microbulbifer sp. CAU 1566]
MQEHPHYQDIVLIGGGHSHAMVLQMWAKNPLPGARLTLVSPQVQSAYSGMLPGMVAGHYSYSDIHIDLPRLCRAAGARFIQACAHHIDLASKKVSLLGRPDLDFDLLSLDVGATPCRHIPGSELAIPVKPIGHFHRYWQQLKQQVHREHLPLRLGVVGGGVGGCELAMAMAWALEEQLYSGRVEMHLIQAGNKLPQEYPLLARRLAARELSRLKVQVHRNWRVTEITPQGVHSDEGKFLPVDKVMLCTEAAAPPWLAQSGLALDDAGFVLIDEYLRAPDHPHIFAVGDVASLAQNPQPKAGTFALRQGPALYRNLRATLLQQPLKPYRPQRNFLSLLTCGSQKAIASRNGFAAAGQSLWHWKDHIDRSFMRRFAELPVTGQAHRAAANRPASLGSLLGRNPQILEQRDNISLAKIRSNGSGAKVAADILGNALAKLPPQQSPGLLRGAGDDAAVLKLPAGKLLVQSSDQLRAPVADPWLFGRLAALHSLSDLFAMHAQPVSAQALVTLPLAAAEIAGRDLQQLLDGAVRELNQHNCVLSGGHTSEGAELQLGLTVNGIADHQQLLNKTDLRAGDCLILTKPLGIGTLFAAEGLGKAKGRWLQQALEVMLQSNATAAEIFARNGANALTDVTGFGLLGHLLEMLQWQPSVINPTPPVAATSSTGGQYQTQLGASLFADALPLLPGATYCAERGLVSSLHQHNTRAYAALQNPAAWQADPHLPLLVDPQTCGGLLASVPADFAEDCITALHAAGCRHAAIIGFVDELPANRDQLSFASPALQLAPQPVYLAKSGDWKRMALRYTEMIS